MEKATERHFACQYTGDEVRKSVLSIALTSYDEENSHIISLSPIGGNHIISKEEGIIILQHFQTVLKDENVTFIGLD